MERPQANSDDSKELTVEVVGNHVYFYADVDPDRTLALMKAVRELDARLRSEHISRAMPEDAAPVPIWLHVQSWGGESVAGLAAADQLSAVKTPVYSVVEGMCCSAATFISCACEKRFITPRSFMMIHQLHGSFEGKHDELEDIQRFYDAVMEQVVKFYLGHTKMAEEAIREALKRDTYLDAQRCIDQGLADAILVV